MAHLAHYNLTDDKRGFTVGNGALVARHPKQPFDCGVLNAHVFVIVAVPLNNVALGAISLDGLYRENGVDASVDEAGRCENGNRCE